MIMRCKDRHFGVWPRTTCTRQCAINFIHLCTYEDVSKSFGTGRLERELQMLQLSATRCSCIAILWVILVSSAAITFCAASRRVFLVGVVDFVIDSVRKLLDTPSQICRMQWRIFLAVDVVVFQFNTFTFHFSGVFLSIFLRKQLSKYISPVLYRWIW
jgi:hypothetical protein